CQSGYVILLMQLLLSRLLGVARVLSFAVYRRLAVSASLFNSAQPVDFSLLSANRRRTIFQWFPAGSQRPKRYGRLFLPGLPWLALSGLYTRTGRLPAVLRS